MGTLYILRSSNPAVLDTGVFRDFVEKLIEPLMLIFNNFSS